MDGPRHGTGIPQGHGRCERVAWLFWRIDDVGVGQKSVFRLLRWMRKHRVPASLQVIPEALDRHAADELLDLMAGTEWRVSVSQHGWDHADMRHGDYEAEFGPHLSRGDQRDRIARGRDWMRELFGDRVTPVFTPPFNAFDIVTLEVLEELGFAGISQDGKQYKRHTAIPDYSACVDVMQEYVRDALRDAREIRREIAASSFPGALCGVQIHPQYLGAHGRDVVYGLMEWAESQELIHTCTLHDIYEAHVLR